MRKICLVFLFGLLTLSIFARDTNLDSLRAILAPGKRDTSIVNALNNMAHAYFYSHPDSSYYYGYLSMTMSEELHFLKGEATGMIMMGNGLIKMGNYPAALSELLHSLKLSELIQDD